jgi:protein-tyrosine phosphatase/arsenate reductase
MVRGVSLLPELETYVAERIAELDEIPSPRRRNLESLSEWVGERMNAGQPVKLIFICTHNSRRSHMAQLWAQLAARVFAVPGVETYSGGTEATAFNCRAVAALNRAGFLVEPFSDGANPIYEVSFEPGMEPLQAFSKVYTDPPNPNEGYGAVLTCAAADAGCPVVFGAERRISIPYEDPGDHDGTEGETAAYDERCRRIAREMLYVFSVAADR